MSPIPATKSEFLIEQLPGRYLILSPDLTIAGVSEAYLKATFSIRENIIGRNIFDAFPDDPCNREATGVINLRASLNYVLQQQQLHDMADQLYDIRRPDGTFEKRYYSSVNSPVFNEQQQLIYIIHEVKDISYRKKSEEKFQALFEAAPDATIFVTEKGIIHMTNEKAEKLFGYSRQQMIGQPVEMLIPASFRHQHVHQRDSFIKAERVRPMHTVDGLSAVKNDGTIFSIDISLSPIHTDEGLLIAASMRDITTDKKLQTQLSYLASIVEQSSEAIISRGADKRLISWNSGAEKMLGYCKEEAMGKTAKELGIIKFTAAETAELENELEEKGNWRSEKQYYHKNGTSFFGVVTANAIKNEAEKIMGVVFIIKDISVRKQLEEQLKRSNEELEGKVKFRTEEIIKSEIRYRHLFENNPMPMWVMDLATFKMLDVNEMALIHYGYTRQQFLSMTALDIRPESEKNIFIDSDHKDTITEHNYNKGIWQHKKKDGTIIQVEIIVHDIIFEGTPARIVLANDVTEKKKAEEKLIASENLFRALIENNNDIIVLMDASFKVFYRSPSATRITGWTNDDMTGLDGTQNIHPDDRETAAAIVKELIANPGKPVNCKFRNQHKNGHYLWVEGVVINLLQDKFVKAIVFNFRDISARIEAEEKLESSENLFRALIENSNDIISLMDNSFQLIYRSPAAARITGWTNEDMMGMDATKNIHVEDKAMAADIVKEVMENPGKIVYTKFRMAHKQGHYLWVEGTLTNLLQDKYVNAIVFNFRDVTARINGEEKLIISEERFRNSLDNMLEGVQIIGFDWRYIYVNDAMARHGKYLKEELLGFSVMEKYPGIEQAEIFKVYQRCFNDRVSIHLENEFEFPDKTKGWFELSFQPVPEGIFVLSVDITDRKKAEQKIIESEANLKAIFDNAAEGFILTDTTGIIKVFNNRVMENILLTPGQKIEIGASIFDYIETARKDFFKPVFSNVVNGETIQYDRCYKASNGTITWINFIFNPVKENDIIKGVCITGRDITTEKIAAQQKEFDRSNLNALINNTSDIMWSIDRSFRLITSNNAFDQKMKAVYTNPPEPGSNIFANVLDKEQRSRYEACYNRAFNGETFTEIVHNKTPDDYWIEISFNPIYEGDTVIGTACFSRDITERKKAEVQLKINFEEKKMLAARMSAILNALPANIALLDKNGIIIDVNDAWRHFATENNFNGSGYGIGSNYITISKHAQGKDSNDGEKVAAGIKAVLDNKAKEFVFEYACHAPKIQRWFRMIATPLQEKKYSGAVVMHIDISELRRLEDARLKSSMEEQKRITMAILQGQEKERNYIGRELHDNVNQILAGTKLFLTSAGHKNEEVKKLIEYPVELLNSSIEEIRSLCRNLVSPIKNIDLEELAKGLLAYCNRSIKTTFTYGVPTQLLCDDLKLNIYRILQELINNTLKYAAATNLCVSVQALHHALTITVADDGIGFEVDSKREGIGISNIINRVESFDGNLEIKSSPGNGCTTTITIPC